MVERKPVIGVMGGGADDGRTEELAEETGRLIAERGGMLVCGGGAGVMRAASRGAAGAGGIVIGILPGSDAGEANEYVTVPVATGMGNARNVINVLTAGAVIAIRGSYGTLSEIALALKCGRPVVSLESWDIGSMGGVRDSLFSRAETPEEAVEKAFSAIAKR